MPSLRETIDSAVTTLKSLGNLEGELRRASDLVAACLTGGHKLIVAGNGGSAADSAHFATEFVVRFMDDRRPYPAIALTESGGTLTAIGNDYKFDDVFARQVEAFGQPGDVVVVFTTSGQSKNVKLALEAAKARGLQSVAFLGRGGGPCKGLATVELVVASEVTARIQEAHKVLLHALCEAVEPRLK